MFRIIKWKHNYLSTPDKTSSIRLNSRNIQHGTSFNADGHLNQIY